MTATLTPPAVRERPILMSGPMVRAILDGRKTQTRRVMLPQPNRDDLDAPYPVAHSHITFLDVVEKPDYYARCNSVRNYGATGDRLWVRETWGVVRMWSLTHRVPPRDEVVYRAGKIMGIPPAEAPYTADRFTREWRDDFKPARWRPSIHMPRRHSRLALELTGVRVERLADCSEGDALAEGVVVGGPDIEGHTRYRAARETAFVDDGWRFSARAAFEDSWDSLNAARGYGWAANPWVWVLDFKRVTE